MFKVGDRVIVKSWEQMEAEFGLNHQGNIACLYTFTQDMKCFCGKCATISYARGELIMPTFDDVCGECEGYEDQFNFSSDMLEAVCHECPDISDEEFAFMLEGSEE